MRIRVSLLIAALSLGAVGQGCGVVACTEKGCLNGTRFVIRSSEGSLPQGLYTVRVVATGLDASVTCTVGGEDTCESPSTRPFVSGSIQGGTLDLTFEGAPAQLEVIVSRDETEIETFTVTPSYEEWRINGESCEPVCLNATETLTLP